MGKLDGGTTTRAGSGVTTGGDTLATGAGGVLAQPTRQTSASRSAPPGARAKLTRSGLRLVMKEPLELDRVRADLQRGALHVAALVEPHEHLRALGALELRDHV